MCVREKACVCCVFVVRVYVMEVMLLRFGIVQNTSLVPGVCNRIMRCGMSTLKLLKKQLLERWRCIQFGPCGVWNTCKRSSAKRWIFQTETQKELRAGLIHTWDNGMLRWVIPKNTGWDPKGWKITNGQEPDKGHGLHKETGKESWERKTQELRKEEDYNPGDCGWGSCW